MRELRLMVIGAVLSAAGLLSACGDDEDTACSPGTEACVCPSTMVCNAGLVCPRREQVRGAPAGARAVTAPSRRAPSPTDPDVICAGMQKYCERFNECAPYYIGLEFGTVAKCTERLTLSCLDAVMAPGTGLDWQHHGRLHGRAGHRQLRRICSTGTSAACNFKGTRATGAACGVRRAVCHRPVRKDHRLRDLRRSRRRWRGLRFRRGLCARPAVQRGRSLRGPGRGPGGLQLRPALPPRLRLRRRHLPAGGHGRGRRLRRRDRLFVAARPVLRRNEHVRQHPTRRTWRRLPRQRTPLRPIAPLAAASCL